MYREPILREVALVSYGTQYLRGDVGLDDWYRHDVFEGATLQFRRLADNALLADDFTLWLCELKEAGAVRLSLHLAAELGGAVPVACEGDRVIVVHHAERHALWVVGRERAAWDRMVTAEDEGPGWLDRFLHSAAYSTDIDSYWLVEERAGALAVSATNWKALAASIGTDLAISVPTQDAHAKPFHVARRSDTWLALPLFPATESSMLAHRVLTTLFHERATFANELNPKNENSSYRNLDEKAAAERDNWGTRLDGWVTEVLLRCANEGRGVPEHLFREPLLRLTPEPAQRSVEASGAAGGGAGTPEPRLRPKWGRRLGFALTAAGVTILLFASAHIVARYPWVALAIGLMMAGYLWREK